MGTKKLKKMFSFGRKVIVIALALVLVFSFVACSGKADDKKGGGNKGGGEIDLTPPTETIPDDKPDDPGMVGPSTRPEDAFTYDYVATTEVGFYGTVTKQVARNKPVAGTRDGGLASYPVYGTNYKGGVAQDEIISESSFLTATGTANAGGGGYTWMDENGFLYSGTRAEPVETGRQLYKHTAAVGNYHGDVNDSESGVEKVVTIRPRGYNSYSVTGIYAPAGEVIKIQLSEEDMERTGGLTIHIGQALYNGQANNIWAGKAMPRMPHLLNTMQVTKNTAVLENGVYTAYVGSFLGGPLYIRNNNAEYTATISGGVEYPHFILGYTTEDEFNRLKRYCSAPYFDLEVWNYGVLLSGAKTNAQRFSYDDLYKAAILWEKISQVTTTGSNQGIVMLFEPFVAAGAAVAFPGRSSVNCPEGWMANSLDYNLMVTSGAWGNFHEYHHNFQGYGVGNGGEVTNNAMTLVSYALFTKISSARTIGNFGGDGLGGGWNRYTSATWALEETLKIARPNENPGNGNQGLALYATLLHNFGPNDFIQAKVAGGGQSYAAYMNAWQNVTHNNMYYYFNNILGGTGISDNADKSYPMFVPVSCVYQTGRSYVYDGEKKYITTMQPYLIKAGEPFTIDLTKYTASGGQYQSGSIVIPDGFSYRVKSISQPAHGTIAITGSDTATYTPDASNNKSGKIIVTLEITKNDRSFNVADVDLVLEFEPTRELNKSVLERTIYTYSEENMYSDATEAFDGGFAGYTTSLSTDHSNPPQTQIVNTDIWYWNNTEAEHNAHPDAPDFYFKPLQDTINVIDGKLYIENDGKYRVYLRGRYNCALYYSLDGKDYALGANIADSNDSLYFRPANAATYFDIEFVRGNVTVNVNAGGGNTANYTINTSGGSIVNWLYIKEVLIVRGQQTGKVPYIGVGIKQWAETMFTVSEKYCDINGLAVEGVDSEGYSYTDATYSDQTGTAVALRRTYKTGAVDYYSISGGSRVRCSEAEFNALTQVQLTEPTVTNNTQPYANAYRRSYEFPDNSEFQSDYFYKRTYRYNYQNNVQLGVGEQSVVEDQCENLFLNTTSWGGGDLSVVVDGIRDMGGQQQLHMNRKPTEAAPFTLVIDLGAVYTANRLYIYSQNRSDLQFPKALKLYASLDGENYTLINSYADLTRSGIVQTLDFADTQMRYYKIEVTESMGNYLIIRELEMWHIQEINGGTKVSIDSANLVFTGDWEYAQAPSSFGHVYVGHSGNKLEFEFTGTRLGIMMSSMFAKNYEVYIDGAKVNSIELKANAGSLVFLSDAMQNASHKVEIRCTGQVGIDSVIIYQ
ncbi:MAG: M60 family metallopeptidase [Clostridiales bacterium]|nr:M60 family metallopeptidase [Clostridiales bacterium]